MNNGKNKQENVILESPLINQILRSDVDIKCSAGYNVEQANCLCHFMYYLADENYPLLRILIEPTGILNRIESNLLSKSHYNVLKEVGVFSQ